MVTNFKNREDAGRQLASEILQSHRDFYRHPQVIVLGLARGGVPVAAEVARVLNVQFDAIVVRKLGMPSHEEYAFGALAPENTSYINQELVTRAGLTESQIQQSLIEQQEVLTLREAKYRAGRGPLEIANRIAIIVDDGIATGATMRAAVMFARKMKAAKVVVAVPISPKDSRAEFEAIADEFICPNEEASFTAVGQFYEDFGQVGDEAVIGLLAGGAAQHSNDLPK